MDVERLCFILQLAGAESHWLMERGNMKTRTHCKEVISSQSVSMKFMTTIVDKEVCIYFSFRFSILLLEEEIRAFH